LDVAADAGICPALLQYVNPARADAGLEPVQCAKEMDWAAQSHTSDMVSMGTLTHDGESVRTLMIVKPRFQQAHAGISDEAVTASNSFSAEFSRFTPHSR
jgi:uncharacterized protein YkwD